MEEIDNRIQKIRDIQNKLSEIETKCEEGECMEETYEITEYYLYIGPHNSNTKTVHLEKSLNRFQMVLPIPQMPSLFNWTDIFKTKINNDRDSFTITRTDLNQGWGSKLKLKVIDIRKSPYVICYGGITIPTDYETKGFIVALQKQQKDDVIEKSTTYCYSNGYNFFILSNPDKLTGSVSVHVAKRDDEIGATCDNVEDCKNKNVNRLFERRTEYNMGWAGRTNTNSAINGCIYEIYNLVRTKAK
jgi:hypothetical protein